MDADRTERQRGWAKVSLGVSMLFAAGAFAYFLLQGRVITGAGFGAIVVIAGIWEYRRRLQDLRASNRYEAEAEDG